MNSFINHGLIDQSVGRQDYCYLVQKLISYSYVFINKNKSLHCWQVRTRNGKYIKFAKKGKMYCQAKVNTECYIASCVFIAGKKIQLWLLLKECHESLVENWSWVFGNWCAYTSFPEQLLLGHSCLTPTSGLCKDLCVCNKSWCCAAVIQNGGTAACFQACLNLSDLSSCTADRLAYLIWSMQTKVLIMWPRN